jgi:hypothetical protein
MLMEELFSRGVMVMGPARNDPGRSVGVFGPGVLERALAARAREMEKFRWIAGEWSYENLVPATRCNPAYVDAGVTRFVISDDGAWVCAAAPDGSQQKYITFDPLSMQWILVIMRGSYGILRSKDGWAGERIAFAGLMTMVGIDCEWRMTWTRKGADEFGFTNEEKAADGAWVPIDEWRYVRKAA